MWTCESMTMNEEDVSECGCVEVSETRCLSPIGSELTPACGVVDHRDKLTENMLAAPLQVVGCFAIPITESLGHNRPGLYLGGFGLRVIQLTDKRGLITSFPP